MSEHRTTVEPPAPPRDERLGQLIAGRYRVIAPLGSGGVAKVYRALQVPLNRQVALKVVRLDLEDAQREQFEARFLREAALAGRLSHPNVVTVHDFGRAEDGSCFIAMELLEGHTLRRLLRGEPLDPRRAARLALGVARGLKHAHKRGLVHRDVKPSNIFITLDDEGQEVPQLLDFGLVKGGDTDTITRSGAFMGTPHYIAPEQARGLDGVDGRADLYSLGCILYRMVTGVLPFVADNPMLIALQHVREPYPPMAQRRPEVAVDAALEAIVRRCMEKEPERRYATADELARALEAWLGEEGVAARAAHTDASITDGPQATLETAPRRRPALVGLVVLLSLGLGAGLGLRLLDRGEPPLTTEIGAPTAAAPAAEAPAAEAPAAEAPAAEAPTAVGPAAEAPAAEAPAAEAPAAEAPKPVASKPVASKPVASKPVAPAAEAPKPAARAPGPASGGLTVDGVRFEPDQAARALDFVNGASRDELLKVGVYPRGVGIILERRPFADLQAFGDTPYIAEKTVRAVADHVR